MGRHGVGGKDGKEEEMRRRKGWGGGMDGEEGIGRRKNWEEERMGRRKRLGGGDREETPRRETCTRDLGRRDCDDGKAGL